MARPEAAVRVLTVGLLAASLLLATCSPRDPVVVRLAPTFGVALDDPWHARCVHFACGFYFCVLYVSLVVLLGGLPDERARARQA